MTPWTVAHQPPLSMELPRQEYWSGLPLPSPGDFLDSGIEPMSLLRQGDSLLSLLSEPTGGKPGTLVNSGVSNLISHSQPLYEGHQTGRYLQCYDRKDKPVKKVNEMFLREAKHLRSHSL